MPRNITQEIYKNHRFINSKRQPKSLKRILCSSTFEEKNYTDKNARTYAVAPASISEKVQVTISKDVILRLMPT